MENITLTKDNIQLIEKIINSRGMASAVVKIEGRKITGKKWPNLSENTNP